jgi:hypothetical protein
MNNSKICKLNFNNEINNNPDEKKILEDIFNIFKTTKIGYIKIKNTKYVLKKEFFVKNYPLLSSIYNILNFNIDEYTFYKKYENKIIKNNFDKNIQLPYKYKLCESYNIYIFTKIDYNLNSVFLKKINKNIFNNILIQSIYIIYFINHILNVFHNDLHQNDKIRNFMINQNKNKNKNHKIELYKNEIKITKYNVILIDFGLFSKNLGFKNILFYNTKSVKYSYFFEIKSELLIVLYIFLINYYLKKNINFKNLYLYFYNNIIKKDLKLFDKKILNSIQDIDNIISYIELSP